MARFERSNFDGARIEEGCVFCAEFIDCTFARAKIIGSKFSGTPFECFGWLQFRGRRKRNEFHGNDFSEAELIDTSFVGGIDLDAQRLPESDDYVRVNNVQERIRVARARLEAWEDEEEKSDVASTLSVLEFLSRDQRDLLLRRYEFTTMPPELSDRMWELLA